MRTLLFTALLAISVSAGCSKDNDQPTESAAAKVPDVTIDELDAKLASKEWVPVDANGETTRKKMGVIPGALLLTDSDTFAPSELPPNKDKPLVFYCANTHCGASHDAASKARTAGYKNVKVLPEGIAGWVKAGKQTASI